MQHSKAKRACACLMLAVGILAQPARAQERTALDSLVVTALSANPAIRAAAERVGAARARVQPAGTLPDPMAGVGIMNLPLGMSYDDMTMNVVSIGQQLPYPGKLSLSRLAAEREVAAAEAELEAARRTTARDVKRAYYELSSLDLSLEILQANQRVLVGFMEAAESRYAVGAAAQADVLQARVQVTRAAEAAAVLVEQRRATAAILNALLDREPDAPLPSAVFPAAVRRLAVAAAADIRFTSASLGARAADSPLPTPASLQDIALRNNAELTMHEARIAAQAARLDLAHKAHRPDFDLSLQYSQRPERADMVSFMVSVPVAVRRGARQQQEVAEQRALLAALHAEHAQMVNQIRADIASLHAQLERSRTRLALFVKSIIPQGRAAVESTLASYRTGRIDLSALLESQATVYEYETEYYRVLTEFAQDLAELERLIGQEIAK